MTEQIIVIGIDASASSVAALRWAADYARANGDQLRAIHVISHDVDSPLAWTPGFPAMAYLLEPESRADREAPIRTLFATVRPEPDWSLEILDGAVGPTLVERSTGADLLVVGTREHVGFGRVMSGSVSHYCLNHSNCPVAAVPPADLVPAAADAEPVAMIARPVAAVGEA